MVELESNYLNRKAKTNTSDRYDNGPIIMQNKYVGRIIPQRKLTFCSEVNIQYDCRMHF